MAALMAASIAASDSECSERLSYASDYELRTVKNSHTEFSNTITFGAQVIEPYSEETILDPE